jgi:fumarate reductase subunit D
MSVFAFVTVLPILLVFTLILYILFVEFVHRLDNTPKMYKIMPIVAFVGCYVLAAQFTANQYLINGASVGLLVVVLTVVSR